MSTENVRWRRRSAPAVLSVILTMAASRVVAAASFQGVGYLPGATIPYSEANAVSQNGLVVVGRGNSASGVEAFRWTEAGGIVGLGDLPGYTASESYAASGDGSVVVGSSEVLSPPPRQAYRWTQATGMVGLGWLPGGEGDRSWARDVSADGLVVIGTSYRAAPNVQPEAFRWTAAGGMAGLGFLPGAVAGHGGAVTADGSIVVGISWYWDGTWIPEATRWTWGGSVFGLGDLAGGDVNSEAFDVSDDGNVVVGRSSSGSYPNREAFRWTPSAGMVGLGALPGATESTALAVSANGSVVVGYCIPQEAFYWDAASGMVRLRDLLVNAYGLDLTGWTLGAATGVSADGLTIVGNGTYEGRAQGWIARIEPISAVPAVSGWGLLVLMLVMAGTAVLVIRRQSHPAQA